MGMAIYHIHQSQKGGITEKMNTIRKMKKNAKALSPVVASIILIAVTVAVSIAVAAWMGALTIGFMATEEVKITSMTFDTETDEITLVVHNLGTSGASINEVWVNNEPMTYVPEVVGANSDVTIQIEYTHDVTTGNNYQVKIVSAKGNPFMANGIA